MAHEGDNCNKAHDPASTAGMPMPMPVGSSALSDADGFGKGPSAAGIHTFGNRSTQPQAPSSSTPVGTYGAVAHGPQEAHAVRYAIHSSASAQEGGFQRTCGKDASQTQEVLARHRELRNAIVGRATADANPPSGNNYAHAVLLCTLATGGAVYEVILKQKAVSFSKMPGSHTLPFDSTSLIIWQSVLSIIIGVVLCRWNRQAHLLCGPGASWAVMRFVPVGCIFSFAAYLQYVILQYLPADVFKTLDQTRLLTVALMSYAMLGYRRTRLSWMLLVLTSVSVVTYSYVRALEETTSRHQELLEFARHARVGEESPDGLDGPLFLPGEDAQSRFAPRRLAKLLSDKDIGPGLLRRLLNDDELAKLVHGQIAADSLKGVRHAIFSEYLTGVFLTVVFVVLMCFASVYAERVLKEDRHIPFYVQKVYLEIPNLLFSIMNASIIAPWLTSLGIGQPPAQTFFENPFCGWDNRWVLLTFVISVSKSWVLGVLVKSLSALTKQLCGVVAVVSTYFLTLVHGCGGTGAAAYSGNAFFCPEGLYRMSVPVVVANFLVLAAVSVYAVEQREAEQPVGKDAEEPLRPKSAGARV